MAATVEKATGSDTDLVLLSPVHPSESTHRGSACRQGQLLEDWESTTVEAEASEVERSDSYRPRPVKHMGDVLITTGYLQRFMIRPHSVQALAWDLLSIAALAVDVFVAPMTVFGVYAPDQFTLFSAFFWSTDICIRFMTGYFDHGILEMRPRRIWIHYLKRSFAFDLLMVSIDWMFVQWNEGGTPLPNGVLRLNRGVRIMRLVRFLRLARFLKMFVMFDAFESWHGSYTLTTVARVLNKIVVIVVINHFIACAWYGLSVHVGEQSNWNNWVGELMSDTRGVPPSTAYEYATALHWALTQFTPASMEVHPRNLAERVFTILVMLVSLLAFSSLIASMTSTMTQLMNRNADDLKQRELLSRFIHEHHVSVDMTTKIATYVHREKLRHERRPVLESQVPILNLLPERIRRELHSEVFTNVLRRHPLFLELDARDAHNLEQVCHEAMRDAQFLMREQVWSIGDRASQMFFVIRGHLRAHPKADSKAASESDETAWIAMDRRRVQRPPAAQTATAGDILSEHALWLHWVYADEAVSITDVAIFILSAAKFSEIVRTGAGLPLLFIYARRFHASVGESEVPSMVCDCACARLLVSASVEEAASNRANIDEGLPSPPSSRQASFFAKQASFFGF